MIDQNFHKKLLAEQFNEDRHEENLSRSSEAFMINEGHDRDFDKISQGTISKYFSNAKISTDVPESSESTKYVKKRILKKVKKAQTKRVLRKDIFRTEKSVRTMSTDVPIHPNAVMSEQFDCINFMANIDNISDMLLSNKISICYLDPRIES